MTPAYLKYAQDVIEGRIVAGELVRLACERFFRFMENEAYEFREEAVDRVLRFFGHLRHFTGRHAGKIFKLEPYQQFAVASIYGFYRREDGTRLTTSVYIEQARKQGKTAFAAGLCLYSLIGDGEMNAEVDLAANSKDQARIAFDMCKKFARGLNPSQSQLRPFKNNITYDRMLSNMNVFAADDSRLDGFNASMWLLDEYHASKDTGLKDVLQSSQGMRENPLGVIITTAGFDKGGPCYAYRTMCYEVLHGVKQDDSLFALIYCLDEDDDWKDECVWVKSNPNLGVTVRASYLRDQVKKALNSPTEEVGIKTKNFNIWCDAETVWIPDHYLVKATQKINIEDFRGMDCYCGVDLSATGDLTSAGFLIPTQDKYYFFARYYLPEAALSENRFKVLYGDWRYRGLITITPGNVTDYDYILNDIKDIGRVLNIQKIAYDTWNATQFTINAEAEGLPMEPFSQALGNFNRSVKECERLFMSGQAVIDNNEINRYCFRNVVLKRDHNGNTKPTKQFAEKKIDGVISMLQALGVYLVSPRYGEFY